MSSIERDLFLFDEEDTRRGEEEEEKTEGENSNKQSSALGYIDISSFNNFC